LLDGGANPDLQDEDGRTALMHATRQNDVASIDWLLANGARRDIVANDGRSCLAMAASDAHLGVLARLLASGEGASAGLIEGLAGEAREHRQMKAAELLQQALRRISAAQ
jgi:ankyrin repeat protein